MKDLSFIDKELQKFNITDSAIAEIASQYMPLAINSVDDKEGHKLVKEARLVVKRYRIDVDKRRKDLNADALEYQRRINGEAKRITALLEPIESHLEAQEKKIDDEIERIKREKEQAEEKRYKERVFELTQLKFMFDGSKFHANYEPFLEIYVLHVKQWVDDDFYKFLGNALVSYDRFVKKEAERKLKEEEDRKALIEERARLDAIAKEQAEKEASLKAESERLEALKRYEESKAAVIESEIECKKNGCEAPIHHRPTIVITQDQVTIEDVGELPEGFWEGFDACLEMVLNSLDNQDSNEIAKFSVWDFIEDFKNHLIEEAELYKQDG